MLVHVAMAKMFFIFKLFQIGSMSFFVRILVCAELFPNYLYTLISSFSKKRSVPSSFYVLT